MQHYFVSWELLNALSHYAVTYSIQEITRELRLEC
jgi:hypothetical protein